MILQKSLELARKWLENQKTSIRIKNLVNPYMRRMKQTFKMLCIQLSRFKIHFPIIKKELMNIASGQVAPFEIKDDILTAHEKTAMLSVSLFNED